MPETSTQLIKRQTTDLVQRTEQQITIANKILTISEQNKMVMFYNIVDLLNFHIFVEYFGTKR